MARFDAENNNYKMENKIAKKRKRFDVRKKFGEQKKPSQIVDEEIKEIRQKFDKFTTAQAETFALIPLSKKTQKGLEVAHFSVPTEIQKQSIPLALRGNDILGAAKTGSGKTLAFIIPILEKLYSLKWGSTDGLGALVVTPTRELAIQTFAVLNNIGKFHSDFSAGLVIGGKPIQEESKYIQSTNIIIATLGRLLQHLHETAGFTADNLQILVLDEADRMLDKGNQKDLTAILDNLPTERQTLLFSATQTKSVKDLARLSLKDPVFVSVHEHAQHSTPAQLQQSYVVCKAEDKINFLWSFIKSHLKQKILIFLSSCKQVRFVYEVFCRLRPGMTILALHGEMKQMKRLTMYQTFCRKQSAVLFATDIAARGLDFPAVHWVVQLDCPEDANTYIHRAGRTARYEKGGESLLVLMPSEETAMVEHLNEKKIPIGKIRVNPKKQQIIGNKLECLLASDVILKQFAQRAFVSYLKSICLMSDKAVFDVRQMDTDKYAVSLGLAVTPRVRFAERQAKHSNRLPPRKKQKTSNVINDSGQDESSNESSDESSDESLDDSDMDLDDEKKEGNWNSMSDDDTDEIFVKKVVRPVDTDVNVGSRSQCPSSDNKKPKKALTKVQVAKRMLKKPHQLNLKIVYDEDGKPLDSQKALIFEEMETDRVMNLEERKQLMKEQDAIDKQHYREKLSREKKLKKQKEKKAKQEQRKKEQEETSNNSVDDENT